MIPTKAEMQTLSQRIGCKPSLRFPLPAEDIRRLDFLIENTKEYCIENQNDAEGYLTLSQLYEWRQDYSQAVKYLQIAQSLGISDHKKQLKKLAQLRAEQDFWNRIGLFPDQFQRLAMFLEKNHCDESFRYTSQWFDENSIEQSQTLNYLEEIGVMNDLMFLQRLVDP